MELQEKPTVAKIATVQKEGDREVIREVDYYNLDMILSIGYRVDSKQATQFRIWATKTLKQHLLDGYTINKKQLLKNDNQFQKTIKDIQALTLLLQYAEKVGWKIISQVGILNKNFLKHSF